MSHTRYLLDRDVLAQLDLPEAHRDANVRAWLRSVPDNALYLSAVTVTEAWRGLHMARIAASGDGRGTAQIRAAEAALTMLLDAFHGRIVGIDAEIARLWGISPAASDRSDGPDWDAAVGATAVAHSMVIATGAGTLFAAAGALVVNPFEPTQNRRSQEQGRSRHVDAEEGHARTRGPRLKLVKT